MRKINCVIAVCSALAALLAWVFECWAANRNAPGVGYPWHLNLSMVGKALAAAACVGWVLVTWQGTHGDRHTRCRKRGHILRGLSQPVCPEYGTPS